MPNVHAGTFWRRIKSLMALVPNHLPAMFAAKTSHANTIWIVIYSSQVVINLERKRKRHAMFVANYSAEWIICASICERISANRCENVIINVHIVTNLFMDHRFSSGFIFYIACHSTSGEVFENVFFLAFLRQHSYSNTYRRKTISM